MNIDKMSTNTTANTYLSEAHVMIQGIRKVESLAKLLRGTGYVETTSPMNTSKSKRELYPYRVVVYHKKIEEVVNNYLSKNKIDTVKFKVLHP